MPERDVTRSGEPKRHIKASTILNEGYEKNVDDQRLSMINRKISNE